MFDSRTNNEFSSIPDLFSFLYDFISEDICKKISGKNMSFEIISFLSFYFEALAHNANKDEQTTRFELAKAIRELIDDFDVKKWNHRKWLYHSVFSDEIQVKGNWFVLDCPDICISQLLDSPYYKPWLVLGDLLKSPLPADDYENIRVIDEDYSDFENRWYSGFCCVEEIVADSCLFHPATIDLTPHEYQLALAYRHQSPEIQETVIRLLNQNNRA